MELSKRDIKQLSGGEKSFRNNLLLIIPLGCNGCPIRCLDEFDVYMDAVNRRLVVEMLINNAKIVELSSFDYSRPVLEISFGCWRPR